MSTDDQTTNAPSVGRATRSDAGVPRGPENRQHCGICGAEGVNRITCTGDAASHAALDKGYKSAPLPVVRGPYTGTHATGSATQPEATSPPTVTPEPGVVAGVSEVVLTVATPYPSLVMARLENWVEENLEEALLVSTEFYRLVRG